MLVLSLFRMGLVRYSNLWLAFVFEKDDVRSLSLGRTMEIVGTQGRNGTGNRLELVRRGEREER